jgi:hypothetical protein
MHAQDVSLYSLVTYDTPAGCMQATSLADKLHQILINLAASGESDKIQTVFSPILAVSGTQLHWVQAMLAKVVDWAASTAEGRLCVQHGTYAPPVL